LGNGPCRAAATEAALQGQPLTPDVIAAAAAKAAEGIDADDDTYASADYKRHMATVYARRAIATAVQRAAR
jgi:carbon-monoxide dehydrogenase medium subunit